MTNMVEMAIIGQRFNENSSHVSKGASWKLAILTKIAWHRRSPEWWKRGMGVRGNFFRRDVTTDGESKRERMRECLLLFTNTPLGRCKWLALEREATLMEDQLCRPERHIEMTLCLNIMFGFSLKIAPLNLLAFLFFKIFCQLVFFVIAGWFSLFSPFLS